MKKLKAKRRLHIGSESVSSFCFGPVALDCEMARRHGWTEKQLERAAEAIRKLSRRESGIAIRRFPERYDLTSPKDPVFLGETDEERKKFEDARP